MTREEAIYQIKNLAALSREKDMASITEALDMAIKALGMAIEALEQEPIVHCEECKHHGTSNCPMWGDDTTEDYMWCCDGERMESGEE